MEHLRRLLQEERKANLEFLGRDQCKDFSHYKYVNGILRGLEIALSHLNEIAKKEINDD